MDPNSSGFHAIPCMEAYDSMHGKVWNENQNFEIQYKDFGFQLLQTMFAVWNRVRTTSNVFVS